MEASSNVEVPQDVINATYEKTKEHYQSSEEVAHMFNAYVNFFSWSIEATAVALESNAQEMVEFNKTQ